MAFASFEESFPPDFAEAVSLLLAAYIAPTLTAGDPQKLGVRAYQLYEFRLRAAQANAQNEQQVDMLVPESEFIRARG